MSIILATPVPEKRGKGFEGSRIEGKKYSFALNPCIFK